MVRHQLGLHGAQGNPGGLAIELEMLSVEMREAVLAANTAYAVLGIPYALVGGLAAGTYGEPRFTKDIDFLVGDEAFVRTGLIVSFAGPMPLQAGRFAIDPIPLPENARRHEILAAAVAAPEFDESTGHHVPMLNATALAYMKLASSRAKDLGDVVAMLRTESVDAEGLVAMIGTDDPELAVRFEAALREYEEVEP